MLQSVESIICQVDKYQLCLMPMAQHLIRLLFNSSSLQDFISISNKECLATRPELQSRYDVMSGVFYVPFRSDTLFPFSQTNLIGFVEDQQVLLVDPGKFDA